MPILSKLTALAVTLVSLGLASMAEAQTAQPMKYVFEGDMVLGHACVLTSQFKPFESVVWRVRVTDPKTGQQMDDKALKGLVVEMSDGQKVPLKFHGHPPGPNPTDNFWSTSWMIPEGHPTGTFSYKIVAIDLGGQETDWQPFKVAPSEFTIVAK
ncbi:MAG TPA: hypothetical protein VG271_20205 [Beijerinckiaceae bacterium]|nr:hypothetical protein [Beijerinckiaceae bacterium]